MFTGLGRRWSTDGWLCNSLGALVGVALAAAVLRHLRVRRGKPHAEQPTERSLPEPGERTADEAA